CVLNAVATDQDAYSVTSTGVCGSDTKPFSMTVNALTATTTPGNQTVCVGAASTCFSTTATGTAPFTFVWKKNGVVITAGAHYTITSNADAGTSQLCVLNAV